MSSALVAEAVMLLVLVGQPSGEQEDTDARKAEAGEHLERGNSALQGGDPAGALEAYRAAYDAFPSPKIFFNMAEAHRELGELVEAADLYERVTNELPPETSLVNLSQERLTELDAQLGRISVATDPAGARIELGGRDAGTSPISDVRVVPGTVEIRATLDGTSEVETVEVEAGESRSVQIDLIEIAPPPPPPPPIAEEDSIASKWWFWTAIGVGVVAAGTAAAVAATSGDGFTPMGELGTTKLDEWRRR